MKRLSKKYCETANCDGLGCLGYQRGNDDEPIEQCKHCKEYTGNKSTKSHPSTADKQDNK